MKTITSHLVLCSKLCLFILVLCGSRLHAAVLENPDFETGTLQGWQTQTDMLSITVSTNDTWNRNYAARISGTHSGVGWVTNTISQTIPMVAGDRIQALGFVYWKTRQVNSPLAQGYVEARLEGPNGMLASQVWTQPHDSWVFFEFDEKSLGVENGGFEQGTIQPWEGADNPDDLEMLISREVSRSGDYALRMVGSWNSGWSFNQVFQVLTLNPGDVVRARAWVKAEELTMTAGGLFAVAGIKLELEGTAHQWEAVVTPPQAGSDWVELKFFAPIVQGGDYVFRCMVAGSSGSGQVTADVYFDDVQVHVHYGDLLNGNFETGTLDHWDVGTDYGVVSVTDQKADEGTYSLNIQGNWSGWSFDRAVQQVYLKSGDQVTLSGRILMDTLDTTGEWLISGVQLSQVGGPNQYEHVFQYHSAPAGWQNLSIVQTIPATGLYEVRCMVMGGAGGASQSDVFFDDMKLAVAGADGGGVHEVTLSLRYVGTAGRQNRTSTIDVYFDTALVEGSSAMPDRVEDIHAILLDNAQQTAAVGGNIPPLDYPPLFSYGYPGGDTNQVIYPTHVEVGIPAWRFRALTNDLTLTLTNTIHLYELDALGEAYIDIDQYMYVGRRWSVPRGSSPDILTNSPYWVLGVADGAGTGFGTGPFPSNHTFVVGQDALTNFPRRMVTKYDGQWPVTLHVVFEENFSQFDREYDKHFVLTTLPSDEASNVKQCQISLGVYEPGYTNIMYESFPLFMGWGTKEEAHGMVDYPNVTYQGHNEVFLRKSYEYGLVDLENWYANPIVRGSATIEPMTLYIRNHGKWNYLPYEEYLFAWPNAGQGIRSIFDEDLETRLPGPVSYHVGFKVGHQYGFNEFGEPEYPGVIEIRGNGYFRMTDYDGVMGGSLRPIAADIFGLHTYREDSPIMPEAYVTLFPRTTPDYELSDNFMRMYLPVRSKTNEWFTGVVKVDAFFAPDQVEDEGTYLEMETDIFANRPVTIDEHGRLYLFAQVNMYWRGSLNVNQTFEGHDHDTIIIKKADGEWITYNTVNPPENIVRHSLSTLQSGDVVYIMQQDRGPESYGYATEAPYRRVSHFEFAILDDGGRNLTLDVYEQHTISEINDNIVIACAVNEDLEQGEHVHSLIRYRSFYAPGVLMTQPNTPDGGDGWNGQTYTIKFYATDGHDESLQANLYYGNGTDEDWTLINVEGPIPVSKVTHLVSYDWDVSSVQPGAYYVKAIVERVEGGKQGFSVSRSRLQVGASPVTATVQFVSPPMYDDGLPHYNIGDDVVQVVSISNHSATALENVTIQLIQEYAETTWWWDTSPHHITQIPDPRWSERYRQGDRLSGAFEHRSEGVTIPAGATLVVTNIYRMPEGRFIDHTLFAIESDGDWYVGRNYDGLAQVRLVVRTAAGDGIYENEQIGLYSMDNDPESYAANLLLNPSFEDGTGQNGWWGNASVTDWNKIGDATGWWPESGGGDPQTPDESDWLIKFWTPGQGVFQDVSISEGSSYMFSVWAFDNTWNNEAMSSAAQLVLKVEWLSGATVIGSEIIDVLSGATVTDNWTELVGTATAPTGADIARFIVVTETSGAWGGAVYFDQASMVRAGALGMQSSPYEESSALEAPQDGGRASSGYAGGGSEEGRTGRPRRDSELAFGAASVPAGGSIRLLWESIAGETYSVWRSTSTLDRADFQRIAEGIAATPPVNEHIDSTAAGRAYYVIEVE